jgi:cyclopropane fatty-acyl-phospholipid synthase-like methyltransferase
MDLDIKQKYYRKVLKHMTTDSEPWDKLAEKYKTGMESVVGYRITKFQVNYIDYTDKYALEKFVKLGKDKKILEIGCGNGRLVKHIAGKVNEVIGIDISEKMIKYAVENCKSFENVNFFVGTVDKLKMQGYFDVAFTVGALKYIIDDDEFERFVKEVYAKLNKNGMFVAIEPTNILTKEKILCDTDDIISVHRHPTEIVKIFEKNNFKLEKICTIRPNFINKLHHYYNIIFQNRIKHIKLESFISIFLLKTMILLNKMSFCTSLSKGFEKILVFTKNSN